jgi:hypothetical protein
MIKIRTLHGLPIYTFKIGERVCFRTLEEQSILGLGFSDSLVKAIGDTFIVKGVRQNESDPIYGDRLEVKAIKGSKDFRAVFSGRFLPVVGLREEIE